MKFHLLIAFAASLTLSACSKVEYFESPKMEEYMLSQAPGLTDSTIHRIEMCDVFASVLFEDGKLYHYKLDMNESRFALQYSTTYGAPDPSKLPVGPPKACLHSAGRYAIKRNVVPVGGQRGLTYNVRGDVLDERLFDDGVKAELRLMALAAVDAMAAQKGPTSPRASWGVSK